MGSLHVVLIDHRIAKRCVYLAMPKQNLNLFDGHALVYRLGRERSSELMGMHVLYACIFTKLPEPCLDPADF